MNKKIQSFNEFNSVNEKLSDLLFSSNVGRIEKFLKNSPDDAEKAKKLIKSIFARQFNKKTGKKISDEVLGSGLPLMIDILEKTLKVLKSTKKDGYAMLNKSKDVWNVGLIPTGRMTL